MALLASHSAFDYAAQLDKMVMLRAGAPVYLYNALYK